MTLALTSEERDRVLGCDDERAFLEWLQRAATADTAADVFEPADD
ncbi:hypothetical protein GCM10027447_06420 [Glycomyces halotolerans]